MDIPTIQRALLSQYGLRIDPAMGEYILSNLDSSAARSLPVIGGDARTGVAIRTTIELSRFGDLKNHQFPMTNVAIRNVQ